MRSFRMSPVRAGAVAIVGCAIFFALVESTSGIQKNPALAGIDSYDPLQDSHIAIRGVVTRVGFEETTLGDWGLVPNGSPQSVVRKEVAKVYMTVGEVLRGSWTDREIVFALSLRGEDALFSQDKEFIVCGKWRKLAKAGIFMTGSHVGIYRQKGQSWVRCVTGVDGSPAETLTSEEVTKRLRNSDVANVTRASDVVARGVIVATWQSEYRTETGQVGALRHYKLRVTQLLKGARQEFIEFVIPRIDVAYVPKWYRETPQGIAEQQEWLVFLRNGEYGLYPFAGANSLLKVEGDALIYDMAVKYPYDVKAAMLLVREEVK
jgi:hypothetical protein